VKRLGWRKKKGGRIMEGGRRKGEGDELADTISFFPPSEGFQEPLVKLVVQRTNPSLLFNWLQCMMRVLQVGLV
jgi:hypothetical protein